jgi:hypothetical protein
MQLSAGPRLCCLGMLCIAAATFAVVPAAGQAPRNDEAEIVIGNNEELKPDEKSHLQGWHDGKPMASADKRILEKAAKWYIYRLTLPQFQERIPPEGAPLSQGRSVYDLLTELFRVLVLPDPSRNLQQPNPNQQRYMQEFTAALIEPIERVLQNAKPIARINAAIVLARLGETGDEAVVKPLLKILNDKNQYDAVKLYALIGLKNVFRAKKTSDPPEQFKDRDDESDYVRDMLEFMVRKPNLPPNATPEEMEAFKYVRREAIRAVAQTRHPLLVKKNKPILLADRRPAQPALELVRIMRNDGINPAPTFAEQIEAAIGICLMNPREDLTLTYQVPYALQHLGLFFVDFADKYEKDRSKTTKTAMWPLESIRLQKALSNLEVVGASTEDKATMSKFVAAAKPMLKRIEEKGESNVRDLRKWLESNKPGDSLYKGEKEATIKTETTQ